MQIAKIFIACIICVSLSQHSMASGTNIRLKTLANESLSMQSVINSGKFTLAMIWATDCPPCEEQKPMIQQFHTDYQSSKASVVGIVIDGFTDLPEVTRLIEQQQPTYPNYIAEPETFLIDFQVATGKEFTGAPTYIMFDANGNTVAVAIGPITRAQLEGAIAQP